jgi:hypothetical protein
VYEKIFSFVHLKTGKTREWNNEHVAASFSEPLAISWLEWTYSQMFNDSVTVATPPY